MLHFGEGGNSVQRQIDGASRAQFADVVFHARQGSLDDVQLLLLQRLFFFPLLFPFLFPGRHCVHDIVNDGIAIHVQMIHHHFVAEDVGMVLQQPTEILGNSHLLKNRVSDVVMSAECEPLFLFLVARVFRRVLDISFKSVD